MYSYAITHDIASSRRDMTYFQKLFFFTLRFRIGRFFTACITSIPELETALESEVSELEEVSESMK